MTRLDTWNQLQANGLKAYREIPEASCALASRRDVKAFKRFIGKQDGLTLDIGCGIEVPGYLDKGNLGRTIGVDPLPKVADFGQMHRIMRPVEETFFTPNWFDLVILAGTLDHILNPDVALSKAHEWVKPSGRIVVQIGIVGSEPRPKLVQYIVGLGWSWFSLRPDLLRKPNTHVQDFVKALPIPAGAVDPFHFKYYTEPEIEALFTTAQLRISRVKRIPGSTFYELRK